LLHGLFDGGMLLHGLLDGLRLRLLLHCLIDDRLLPLSPHLRKTARVLKPSGAPSRADCANAGLVDDDEAPAGTHASRCHLLPVATAAWRCMCWLI
jgi:hypothetical protein